MRKIKKSTKTGGKKPTKSLLDIKPRRILNKKNAIEFANYLYSEKSDGKQTYCSYTKMCFGKLLKGNKQPLSCILGEAYVWFIDQNLSVKELKKEVSCHEKEMFEPYKALYYQSTEELICYLLAKNSNTNKSKKLQNLLNDLPEINDDIFDDEEGVSGYIERAYSVKEFWMKRIVPLLK